MKIKLIFFFLNFMLLQIVASAQETWGISNSNFAGNLGIFLNPSSIVLAPYKSEINLLSGDVFIDNNYLYIKSKSGVFAKSIKGESVPNDRIGDYYTQIPDKMAYGSLYLMGPSYIRNKKKYAWGVHAAVKSVMSARHVPNHLAKFIYEGFDYIPQQGIDYTAGPFKSAALGWAEIGGTYARVLNRSQFDQHILKAGITLNFLAGFYGLYLKSDNIEYNVPNSQLLVVNKMYTQYGHSSPIDGDNLMSELLKVRGIGASATVGFTYINNFNATACECYESADDEKKYNYRLGMSFIDFGYIHFNAKATREFNYKGNSAYWPGIDTTKFTNLFSFDTLLSNRFYGSPLASLSGRAFNIYLPSAVSMQFDYNIIPKYYVNATIIKSVPVSDISVQHANQLSVTARYETRRKEVSIPLTFFEYTKPHLGLAIRYGILVLGTDRLGTYLGLWNATGFDFFFGIKLSHCEKIKRKSKTGCDI